MIDSINLIIYIKWLDFKLLEFFGIKVKRYINNRSIIPNMKDILIVSEDEPNEIWTRNKDYGYSFSYKTVYFIFSVKNKYLLLITNAHKILEKKEITLSDITNYQNAVGRILNDILPHRKYTLYLNRIDYHIDIQLKDEEEMKLYIDILNKHNKKFHYMKKRNNYLSSLYLTTKQGQFTLNIYNKEEEQMDKYGIKSEEYENVLRLEIQNRPARIKAEAKRKSEPVEKKLENYFSKEGMEKGFFELLSKYLYEGDYYTKRSAKQKINRNTTLKQSQKERIKNYIDAVASTTPREAYEKQKVCCEDTANRYIKILNKLGINPVTLENNCSYNRLENLVKRARQIAENKYFK